jgi:hypothetical protein
MKIMLTRGTPFKDSNTGAVHIKVTSPLWMEMIFLSQRTLAQSRRIMPKKKERNKKIAR